MDLPLTPMMKVYRAVPVREAWYNAPLRPGDDPDSPYRIDGDQLLKWWYFRIPEIGGWDVEYMTEPFSNHRKPVAVSIHYEVREQLRLKLDDAA